MPASGAIKLLDANVWLAVALSDHVHHAKAKVWFESQDDDSCAFCRITQLALLRHLTNARIMGRFVQTQQNAWKTTTS
jgi:predicted nucleic acid-binding protein